MTDFLFWVKKKTLSDPISFFNYLNKNLIYEIGYCAKIMKLDWHPHPNFTASKTGEGPSCSYLNFWQRKCYAYSITHNQHVASNVDEKTLKMVYTGYIHRLSNYNHLFILYFVIQNKCFEGKYSYLQIPMVLFGQCYGPHTWLRLVFGVQFSVFGDHIL